jgi:hypothetical protein
LRSLSAYIDLPMLVSNSARVFVAVLIEQGGAVVMIRLQQTVKCWAPAALSVFDRTLKLDRDSDCLGLSSVLRARGRTQVTASYI